MSIGPVYNPHHVRSQIFDPDTVSVGVDSLNRLCLCLESEDVPPLAVALCPLEDAHHIEYMIRATIDMYAARVPTPRDVFGGGRA